MEKVRISKLLSQRGLCSRREAEQYIDEGKVLLNGVVVTEQGTKALPTDTLEITKSAERTQNKKITVIFHKPLGIVSNLPEPGYREAAEFITEENHWESDPIPFSPIQGQLNVVGRLDVNSKGLLILSQDGRIAKHIIGPESDVEKEYIVRFQGAATPKVLSLLRFGLSLDGKKLKKAFVELKEPGTLRFILKEGKKRQLRRMCELVQLEVTSLKRVRVGSLQLGSLPPGKWRYAEYSEIFQ